MNPSSSAGFSAIPDTPWAPRLPTTYPGARMSPLPITAAFFPRSRIIPMGRPVVPSDYHHHLEFQQTSRLPRPVTGIPVSNPPPSRKSHANLTGEIRMSHQHQELLRGSKQSFDLDPNVVGDRRKHQAQPHFVRSPMVNYTATPHSTPVPRRGYAPAAFVTAGLNSNLAAPENATSTRRRMSRPIPAPPSFSSFHPRDSIPQFHAPHVRQPQSQQPFRRHQESHGSLIPTPPSFSSFSTQASPKKPSKQLSRAPAQRLEGRGQSSKKHNAFTTSFSRKGKEHTVNNLSRTSSQSQHRTPVRSRPRAIRPTYHGDSLSDDNIHDSPALNISAVRLRRSGSFHRGRARPPPPSQFRKPRVQPPTTSTLQSHSSEYQYHSNLRPTLKDKDKYAPRMINDLHGLSGRGPAASNPRSSITSLTTASLSSSTSVSSLSSGPSLASTSSRGHVVDIAEIKNAYSYDGNDNNESSAVVSPHKSTYSKMPNYPLPRTIINDNGDRSDSDSGLETLDRAHETWKKLAMMGMNAAELSPLIYVEDDPEAPVFPSVLTDEDEMEEMEDEEEEENTYDEWTSRGPGPAVLERIRGGRWVPRTAQVQVKPIHADVKFAVHTLRSLTNY